MLYLDDVMHYVTCIIVKKKFISRRWVFWGTEIPAWYPKVLYSIPKTDVGSDFGSNVRSDVGSEVDSDVGSDIRLEVKSRRGFRSEKIELNPRAPRISFRSGLFFRCALRSGVRSVFRSLVSDVNSEVGSKVHFFQVPSYFRSTFRCRCRSWFRSEFYNYRFLL